MASALAIGVAILALAVIYLTHSGTGRTFAGGDGAVVRAADVAVAVSNSSGFGGHNASIALRRFAG